MKKVFVIKECVYDNGEPESCSIISCNEDINALWFVRFSNGRLSFWESFCKKHFESIIEGYDLRLKVYDRWKK